MPRIRPKFFHLQWHITASCVRKCKHCYLYKNAFWINTKKAELSTQSCIRILDNFQVMLKKWKATGHIAFTGGDVLLCKNRLWTLVRKARASNISCSILGNADLLTNNDCRRFVDLGITFYQLSLDGLEKTHDGIRGNGSFRRALEAICLLKEMGVKTAVMFTLSKHNMEELVPVMRLVAKIGVDSFAFDREVPHSTRNIERFLCTKEEIKDLCYLYLDEKDCLKKANYQTKFGFRPPILRLCLENNDERQRVGVRYVNEQTMYTGCPVAQHVLAIMPNGNVIPCSRLPIVVGEVPKEGFDKIYDSELLSKLRDRRMYEECRNCSIYQLCKGCRAMAFAVTGSPFSRDPHCWKYSIQS